MLTANQTSEPLDDRMNVMIYAGVAGDRNDRGMKGAAIIGARIASEVGFRAQVVASSAPIIEGGWREQLRHASASLRQLRDSLAGQLCAGGRFIVTMGRCAAGVATLPVIARRFPDAAIVWFDAHGDCNVPTEGDADDGRYLGGMVISGAAGEWDTGLGKGLDLANVILVGARELDLPEQARVDCGQIRLVAVGPGLAGRLKAAVGRRRVYIHLDCDVLSAGLLATEYQCPDGLSFDELRAALAALAEGDVLGLEIAEYEDCWPDGRENRPDALVSALRPLIESLKTSR
jgi:arginase